MMFDLDSEEWTRVSKLGYDAVLKAVRYNKQSGRPTRDQVKSQVVGDDFLDKLNWCVSHGFIEVFSGLGPTYYTATPKGDQALRTLKVIAEERARRG